MKPIAWSSAPTRFSAASRNPIALTKSSSIGKALIRLSAEECWSIGTVGVVPDPVVVSRRLGNVPENLLSEHLLSSPNNAGVIQVYYK